VPLVVRGPGVPQGAKDTRLVVNNDLAPTFAALAGTSMPGADGRSLLLLLKGENPPWRDAFLLENREDPSPSDVPTYEGVRTQDYLYVEYEGGERELYDLNADPYELENAYRESDPARLEELRVRLEALKDCSGADCREAKGP
jgi:N-acetylglucosamine-6-sulfatase